MWEWDLTNDYIEWSDRLEAVLGHPVSEATSSTQPSPTIDNGNRPTKAASTMGRACGVRRTCR